MKKLLSFTLTLTLLISMLAFTASAEPTYQDIAGHWASDCIEAWSGYGVINGYAGNFNPDRSMTRGEFAVVLDRIMKYQKIADNTFTDLKEDFYTSSILRLNEAGVMTGYDSKITPTDVLTREQAAVMLCRALGIKEEDAAKQSFPDADKISDWAKGFLNALSNRGLMNGDEKGYMNPGAKITRAEVVKILDNSVVPVLSSGEMVKNLETTKILVISAPNVTLLNCTVSGNILITQGVTEGGIHFVESELSGELSADTELTQFVTLENCTLANEAFMKSEAIGSTSGTTVNNGTGENPAPTTTKTPEATAGTATPAPTATQKPSISGGGGGGGNTGGGNSGGGTITGPTPTPVPTPTPEPTPTPVPTPEPTPEPDYASINAEVITNLEMVSEELNRVLYEDEVFSFGPQKELLVVVKNCVDETIPYGSSAIIDEKFIRKTFPEQVAQVQSYYDEIQEMGEESAFRETLSVNVAIYVIEYLLNFFGVDV